MHDCDWTGPIVLCVDDEPNVLAALERVLRRQGWRVLQARNGKEAIESLQQNQVEVILCDEAMPGMRGVEVLGQAKLVSPKTVRILLTAHCGEQKVVVPAVNESEVFRLLSKPWNEEDLLDAANAALGMTPKQWRQRESRVQERLCGL